MERNIPQVDIHPGVDRFDRFGGKAPGLDLEGILACVQTFKPEIAEAVSAGSALFAAAAEGAGLGLGGIITIVPDLGILSAITMRMIQKLSLVYGFEMNTDDEIAELWIAAASAAGVDISRELVEREVVRRFVPKVIQRIAARATFPTPFTFTSR